MSIQSSRTVIHQEAGIALLGSVLVAALVLGLAGWGILNMTKVAQQSVYGESAANQARTAALIGIQAVTGYAQSVYVGSNPSTASLSYLQTQGLYDGDAPVNQSFTQPTNASVQSMITANTFSSVQPVTGSGTSVSISTIGNGYIKMLSTGRSGSAIQTAEAYLTAQLNSLSSSNVDMILGSNSTFDGTLGSGIVVESNDPAKVKLNGTSAQYIPISHLPVIRPKSFESYATIVLGSNGYLTIPASAASFYGVTINTASAYTCEGSTCSTSLSSEFTYKSGTWTINKPVPAFIYTSENIIIGFSNETAQLTIAAGGSITIPNSVTLYPFAYYPSGSTTSTLTIPENLCANGSGLPVCYGDIPYQNLQGLIFIATGDISDNPGTKSQFYGSILTNGSLTFTGTGTPFVIGGMVVAENNNSGDKTTVNGHLTFNPSLSNSQKVTTGGYQLTASSIRWVP